MGNKPVRSRSAPKWRPPNVTIIGAGYAGLQIARSLVDIEYTNFTVLNERDTMHHNLASVRAAVEPGYANKTLIPLRNMLGDRLKVGKVSDINPKAKKITFEPAGKPKQILAYDYLIVATGSKGMFPHVVNDGSREDMLRQYEELTEKVADAKRVVIVGGGATGVEQAAEVAYRYPETEVTLIHGGEQLVNNKNLTPAFLEKLDELLEKYRVKVIRGERVTNVEEAKSHFATSGGPFEIVTDKGMKLEADFAFFCSGLKTNNDAYKSGLKSAMNELGQLKVNEFLQVEGFPEIFAVGDCNDVKCKKMAYLAGMQAGVVGESLKSLVKPPPQDSQLKSYDPTEDVPLEMILVVTPESGLGQTVGGDILPEEAAKSIKSAGMFNERFWEMAKLPVPE